MTDWKEKRVLVTGSTGLVGSHLTRTLVEKQAKVVVLIRDHDPQSELIRSGIFSKVDVVCGSLEDGVSVERAICEYEIETIFHLGAQTQVGCALHNPLYTFEANIRGTYILLEACRKHRSFVKEILIASSDKAYGSSPVLPYTEDMPLRGEHPYDVSKSCADLIALSYYTTYKLPLAVARCGNIYGGGDLNWKRLIPGTIKSLLFGQRPEIRSDGSYTRDYIYVGDVTSAYLQLAASVWQEDVQGQAFNFGPEHPYSVMEIVETLQDLLGKKHLAPRITNTAKAEILHQTLNSKKAEKLLQWKPLYGLEEGLAETISWYENYFSSSTLIGAHA
jgi:CDP-glucose 4,6-dehydratase